MTTDAYTDRLSEYLDGELSPAERAAVDAHLVICPECRENAECEGSPWVVCNERKCLQTPGNQPAHGSSVNE